MRIHVMPGSPFIEGLIVNIAVGDRMLLGMQDFEFAQILSLK